jgi:hypothetical protein
VTINGTHYNFNISLINVGTNASIVTARTLAALNGTYGDCYIYFGPFSSGWQYIMSPIIENARQIMIAPLAAASDIFECGTTTYDFEACFFSSTHFLRDQVAARPPCVDVNTRRYYRTWGLIPPAERFWDDTILQLKLLGAESVSVWASNDLFTQVSFQKLESFYSHVRALLMVLWLSPIPLALQ